MMILTNEDLKNPFLLRRSLSNPVKHTRDEIQKALVLSCHEGLRISIGILLEHGADPNEVDIDDVTTVKLMEPSGLDYVDGGKAYFFYSTTPLQTCVMNDDCKSAELLLSKKANPNLRGKSITDFQFKKSTSKELDLLTESESTLYLNLPPLHLATRHGHKSMVELLLKSGAHQSCLEETGEYPIHIAAREGHCHLIRLFCVLVPFLVNRRTDKGSLPGSIPGRTSLFIAGQRGHVDVVYILVDAFNADMTVQDEVDDNIYSSLVIDDISTFNERERENKIEICKFYLRRNISFKSVNVNGINCLDLAVKNGYTEIAELLQSYGLKRTNTSFERTVDDDQTPNKKKKIDDEKENRKPSISNKIDKIQSESKVNEIPSKNKIVGPSLDNEISSFSVLSKEGGERMYVSFGSPKPTDKAKMKPSKIPTSPFGPTPQPKYTSIHRVKEHSKSSKKSTTTTSISKITYWSSTMDEHCEQHDENYDSDSFKFDRSFRSISPASFLSEGDRNRNLKFKVFSSVPKAYDRKHKKSARKDFILHDPVKIETVEDGDDDQSCYSLPNNLEDAYLYNKALRRRMKWSQSAKEDQEENDDTYVVDKNKAISGFKDKQKSNAIRLDGKLIGFTPKPYKSFGRINVNTDLLENGMDDFDDREDEENSGKENDPLESGEEFPSSDLLRKHNNIKNNLKDEEEDEWRTSSRGSIRIEDIPRIVQLPSIDPKVEKDSKGHVKFVDDAPKRATENLPTKQNRNDEGKKKNDRKSDSAKSTTSVIETTTLPGIQKLDTDNKVNVNNDKITRDRYDKKSKSDHKTKLNSNDNDDEDENLKLLKKKKTERESIELVKTEFIIDSPEDKSNKFDKDIYNNVEKNKDNVKKPNRNVIEYIDDDEDEEEDGEDIENDNEENQQDPNGDIRIAFRNSLDIERFDTVPDEYKRNSNERIKTITERGETFKREKAAIAIEVEIESDEESFPEPPKFLPPVSPQPIPSADSKTKKKKKKKSQEKDTSNFEDENIGSEVKKAKKPSQPPPLPPSEGLEDGEDQSLSKDKSKSVAHETPCVRKKKKQRPKLDENFMNSIDDDPEKEFLQDENVSWTQKVITTMIHSNFWKDRIEEEEYNKQIKNFDDQLEEDEHKKAAKNNVKLETSVDDEIEDLDEEGYGDVPKNDEDPGRKNLKDKMEHGGSFPISEDKKDEDGNEDSVLNVTFDKNDVAKKNKKKKKKGKNSFAEDDTKQVDVIEDDFNKEDGSKELQKAGNDDDAREPHDSVLKAGNDEEHQDNDAKEPDNSVLNRTFEKNEGNDLKGNEIAESKKPKKKKPSIRKKPKNNLPFIDSNDPNAEKDEDKPQKMPSESFDDDHQNNQELDKSDQKNNEFDKEDITKKKKKVKKQKSQNEKNKTNDNNQEDYPARSSFRKEKVPDLDKDTKTQKEEDKIDKSLKDKASKGKAKLETSLDDGIEDEEREDENVEDMSKYGENNKKKQPDGNNLDVLIPVSPLKGVDKLKERFKDIKDSDNIASSNNSNDSLNREVRLTDEEKEDSKAEKREEEGKENEEPNVTEIINDDRITDDNKIKNKKKKRKSKLIEEKQNEVEDEKMLKEDDKMLTEDDKMLKEDDKLSKENDKLSKEDDEMLKEDDKMLKEDDKMLKEDDEMLKKDDDKAYKNDKSDDKNVDRISNSKYNIDKSKKRNSKETMIDEFDPESDKKGVYMNGEDQSEIVEKKGGKKGKKTKRGDLLNKSLETNVDDVIGGASDAEKDKYETDINEKGNVPNDKGAETVETTTTTVITTTDDVKDKRKRKKKVNYSITDIDDDNTKQDESKERNEKVGKRKDEENVPKEEEMLKKDEADDDEDEQMNVAVVVSGSEDDVSTDLDTSNYIEYHVSMDPKNQDKERIRKREKSKGKKDDSLYVNIDEFRKNEERKLHPKDRMKENEESEKARKKRKSKMQDEKEEGEKTTEDVKGKKKGNNKLTYSITDMDDEDIENIDQETEIVGDNDEDSGRKKGKVGGSKLETSVDDEVEDQYGLEDENYGRKGNEEDETTNKKRKSKAYNGEDEETTTTTTTKSVTTTEDAKEKKKKKKKLVGVDDDNIEKNDQGTSKNIDEDIGRRKGKGRKSKLETSLDDEVEDHVEKDERYGKKDIKENEKEKRKNKVPTEKDEDTTTAVFIQPEDNKGRKKGNKKLAYSITDMDDEDIENIDQEEEEVEENGEDSGRKKGKVGDSKLETSVDDEVEDQYGLEDGRKENGESFDEKLKFKDDNKEMEHNRDESENKKLKKKKSKRDKDFGFVDKIKGGDVQNFDNKDTEFEKTVDENNREKERSKSNKPKKQKNGDEYLEETTVETTVISEDITEKDKKKRSKNKDAEILGVDQDGKSRDNNESGKKIKVKPLAPDERIDDDDNTGDAGNESDEFRDTKRYADQKKNSKVGYEDEEDIVNIGKEKKEKGKKKNKKVVLVVDDFEDEGEKDERMKDYHEEEDRKENDRQDTNDKRSKGRREDVEKKKKKKPGYEDELEETVTTTTITTEEDLAKEKKRLKYKNSKNKKEDYDNNQDMKAPSNKNEGEYFGVEDGEETYRRDRRENIEEEEWGDHTRNKKRDTDKGALINGQSLDDKRTDHNVMETDFDADVPIDTKKSPRSKYNDDDDDNAFITEVLSPGTKPPLKRNIPPLINNRNSMGRNQASTDPKRTSSNREPFGNKISHSFNETDLDLGGGNKSAVHVPRKYSHSKSFEDEITTTTMTTKTVTMDRWKRRSRRRPKSVSFDNKNQRRMPRDKPLSMKMPDKSLQQAAFEMLQVNQAENWRKKYISQPLVYTRGVYHPDKPLYKRDGGVDGGYKFDESRVSQAFPPPVDDEEMRNRLRNMEDDEETLENQSYNEDEQDDYGDNKDEFEDEESPERNGQFYDQDGNPVDIKSYPQRYAQGVSPLLFNSLSRKVTYVKPLRRRKRYRTMGYYPMRGSTNAHGKDLPPRYVEPGPVDFSKYGHLSKIWMEQVDRRTVQKSETMYLSVLPSMVGENFDPSENSFFKRYFDLERDRLDGKQPLGSQNDGSQWVIARGRSVRKAKRKWAEQRDRLQSADSSFLDGSPNRSRYNQSFNNPNNPFAMLFFKIGQVNWPDLAWVLFDGIQSDSETVRMIADIRLKHDDDVAAQIREVMARWWTQKGDAATIEELQSALEFVNIPFIHEEDQNASMFYPAEDQSQDDQVEEEIYAVDSAGQPVDHTGRLYLGKVPENDPDVTRLIHEYETKSPNASYIALNNSTNNFSFSNINRQKSPRTHLQAPTSGRQMVVEDPFTFASAIDDKYIPEKSNEKGPMMSKDSMLESQSSFRIFNSGIFGKKSPSKNESMVSFSGPEDDGLGGSRKKQKKKNYNSKNINRESNL